MLFARPSKETVMTKKVLSAGQIRELVLSRIHKERYVGGDRSEILVPLPTAHSVDAEQRNWDMKDEHHDDGGYVRKVIEEARREFLLSDAAERDEIIGNSFAHS
jgi:hypothetical protein